MKSIGSYWDVYHMPIIDRKYNLSLLIDKIEEETPKDPNSITMEDMVKKDTKSKFKVPDFVIPSKK